MVQRCQQKEVVDMHVAVSRNSPHPFLPLTSLGLLSHFLSSACFYGWQYLLSPVHDPFKRCGTWALAQCIRKR